MNLLKVPTVDLVRELLDRTDKNSYALCEKSYDKLLEAIAEASGREVYDEN